MSEKLTEKEQAALWAEIQIAEKRNEVDLIPKMKENLARYTGDYVPDIGTNWDIVLNEYYPIVQFHLPSIYYRNPRVFLKPKNKQYVTKKRNPISGEFEEVTVDSEKSAKTQEAILNYHIDQTDYKKEVRFCLLDALLFPHGVLWHGFKGDFGMTDEQSMLIENKSVFSKRITPSRFLHDPAVPISRIDEGRWVGRSFDIPLIDVLEDDELDFDEDLKQSFTGYGEVIQHTIKSGGQDKKYPSSTDVKSLIDYADSKFKEMTESQFVTIYEIIKRPTKKERKDGKKGKIILLCKGQQRPMRVNSLVYKIRGFPVEILQFNELPDSPFGLDDFSTYRSIVDNKNIIRNLQIRNAQESSKSWIALAKDGTSEEDIDKIKVGDQTIVLFDGETVQGKMTVATPGAGASNELYLIDGRMDKELMDKSTVNDLKRGFAQSGEESATSVRERVAGGSVRPQYRQDVMADFLRKSLTIQNALLKQFTPYKEAVRIVGSLDIEWSETPEKEELQAPTDVEIDVYSLVPENPEREMREITQILNLAMQALQNPQFFQKLQTEGYTFNFHPLISQLLYRMRLRNPEIFRRIREEESMGFASIQQLKQAHANVLSTIQGQGPAFPPQASDDHLAKMDVYQAVLTLLQATGTMEEVMQPIMELLQVHAQMQSELEAKEAPKPGQKVS